LKQYSGFQAVNRSVEDEEEELLDGMGVLGGVQVPNEVSEEEDEAVPPQTGSKRSHSVRMTVVEYFDREDFSACHLPYGAVC
jgi:hypothetical protein